MSLLLLIGEWWCKILHSFSNGVFNSFQCYLLKFWLETWQFFILLFIVMCIHIDIYICDIPLSHTLFVMPTAMLILFHCHWRTKKFSYTNCVISSVIARTGISLSVLHSCFAYFLMISCHILHTTLKSRFNTPTLLTPPHPPTYFWHLKTLCIILTKKIAYQFGNL